MKRISKGFTIVEVAIVLAIAGLILSLVFIGVGQANKASRDSQRKQDANYFATAIEQWAQNNNGQMPVPNVATPAGSDFNLTSNGGAIDTSSPGPLVSQNYIDLSKFKDPLTDGNYTIYYINSTDTTTDPTICPSQIDTFSGARLTMQAKNDREVKLYMCLESGYYEVGQ